MKIVKAIFNTALAALAVMAAFACQKDPQNGGEGASLNEALELAVDVDDITYTSAKIKVTHNGDKSDTWYGFLTEDVTADEDALIDAAAQDYMDGNSSDGIRKSKSYVTVIEDLLPGTSYKYIAFGLSADGVVYGTSASAEFKTASASGGNQGGGSEDNGDEVVDGMRTNPAWTVNYVGEGVIDDVEYDHIVTVNSTDKNTYAITVVYASLWDVNELYEMSVLFAEDLNAYVEEYNASYGTSYTVGDLLYSGSKSDAFDLDPGYYRAVALGIKPDGTVSGLYSVSDVFEVKEPLPTEEYKAWLGDWTIVGENGAECNITLTRHVTNKSFWMSGWEGFDDLYVDVEYSKERNDITFYAQLVEEDYYYEEADAYIDMYFLGGDKDGNFYSIDQGGYYIALAGILDGGQRALVRYGVNTPGYPTFVNMFFATKIDGEYLYFTPTEELPSFRGIAEMNPAGQTAASSALRPSLKLKSLSR